MRTFHSFIQSSKARYLLLAAGMALTSPMMAGCPVHPKAHHSLAQPLHAYGKLLGNNTIGSWHPTVYWGISEPDSGSGLRNLDEWLANCDAAMPTFHPVLDPDVQITAGFVEPSLENGPQTHSGIDYARPDGRSFRVFTIAEGRVIFKGYHPSTGNVVIVEHSPIDGVPFRSIYQHLRDGRDHDVELALRTSDFIDQDPSWNWDVYARNYVERATRARDMIKGSDIDRSWMDRFWGTNEQTIGVQEGDYVMSGQAIGWAGCTGIHSHGNQLHFGVARQANFVDAGWEEEHPLPGITRWVFFDPYGLYGGPNDLAAYNRDDGMRGPRQHASIFAPTPEDVAGLDLDEFERAVHYYERFDYRPICVSVDYLGDSEALTFLPFHGPNTAEWSISALFRYRPDGARPILRKDLVDLERELARAEYSGFRPTAIIPAPSPTQGVRYHALMREQDGRRTLAEARMDPETFEIHNRARRQQGYVLSNFFPYYDQGKLWFSACWIEPRVLHEYESRFGMSKEEFEVINTALNEDGNTLVRFVKYPNREDGYDIAALWYGKDSFALGPYPAMADEHFLDLDPETFTENRREMEDRGYELTFMDASDGKLNLVYHRFDRPDPSEEVTVAIDIPEAVTRADLIIDNIDPMVGGVVPAFGEILADSSIAPMPPARTVARMDAQDVQFKDPATGKQLPAVSKLIQPILVQAENILSSIQVTGGELKSDYLRGPDGAMVANMQAIWTKATRGAMMRVPLAVPRTGRYRLKLNYAEGPDTAVVQCYFNGRILGQPINAYAITQGYRNDQVVAEVDLNQGVNYIDLRIRGKDKRSSDYHFGIDQFELVPLDG